MSVKVSVLADDSVLFPSRLLAQHGVSYFIEVRRKEGSVNILLDTGIYGKVVVDNAKELGIDLSKVDIIFLTHCHYDHTEGLIDVLKAMKKEVPIVAHPDLFRPCYVKRPSIKYIGVPSNVNKEEIEKNRGKLVLVNRPFEIAKGIWSTGEVPRITDFEDVGVEAFTIKNGKWVKDEMLDDMSLIIEIEDGVLVVAGCSHAGIINILEHAKRITKRDRILGIIGGLHLIKASEERLSKTTEKLKEMKVERIYAGHCTGFKAQYKLYKEFRENFKPLATGMEIEF